MEYYSLNILGWYLPLRQRGVIVWIKLKGGLEIGGTIVAAHLEATAGTVEVPFSERKMMIEPLTCRGAELVGVEYPLQKRVGSMV